MTDGGYLYDGKGVRVTLYLEAVVVERLDMYAKANGRSRSWMVNSLIKSPLGVLDEEAGSSVTGTDAGGGAVSGG